MDYYNERAEVAKIMVKLYDRGLTTVSGGNISLRLNDALFCISPSALDKSCLKPETVAIIGFDGTNHTPEFKLSIESEMHRRLLLARPDINAVVHSHPVYCSLFSAAEAGPCAINTKLTAESYYFVRDVVNVPYALMGTDGLADAVEDYGKNHDVMLMQNHGAIALGLTLLNAFDKLDLLERAAEMTVAYNQMMSAGLPMRELDEAQLREIEKM
ncbi:MAG: class II aldolase/adducin family protein [Candidatus Thiodiazotropha taylori]|nr:class II aldolase/adducin family protein [Candidatus Thiodiazotropha taylori]MCW4292370.1 class II aldolase/adducin family protein [Candidatus Thiodiazotropha taylori]